MMGYYSLVSLCGNCKVMFTSNPNLVPSINNQAICKSCIDWANLQRKAKGIAVFHYDSQAYEAADEKDMIL